MISIAQVTLPGSQARTGSRIAEWADTPEETAAVWIGGGIALVIIVVALVKLRDLRR